MNMIIQITTAIAMILSIIVPFGYFFLGEKSKKRYKKSLIANCFMFFGVLLVATVVSFAGTASVQAAGSSADGLATGLGYLGAALVNSGDFAKRGFIIKGVFDNNHELKGKKIGSLDIMMMDELKGFIKENNIEIVALTIPRQAAREVAKEVAEDGIKAIWNFAHTDLNMPEDVVVENVHLSESLMRLSYNIANKNGKTRNIQEG